MKTVKDAVEEFKGEWPNDTNHTNYWFAGSLSNMHYEIDGVLNHVCSKKEFEDYAKKMELNKSNKDAVKQVFTKEMADNMELPPIGAEALLSISKFAFISANDKKYNNHHCEIVAHVDSLAVAVVRDENSDVCFTITANYGWFKPIDTRTDEEKLFDEVAEFIELSSNCNSKAVSIGLIEKFDIKLK